MASKTPTVRIDIEPHLANIDGEVKKYEDKLKKLQKQAEDMGFGDNIIDDIQKCINKLNELKSEYSNELRKLSNQKIDTDAFDKFSKEIDSRLEEVTGNMTNLEEKISQLSKTMEDINGEKMAQQLGKIKRTFQEFRHDTKDAIEVLKEFQELINVKGNQKELQDLSKTISKLSNIDMLNLDGIKVSKKQLSSLQEELGDTYQTYKELQDLMESSTSPTVLKNTEKKVAELIPQITELIKKIAQANKFDPVDLEQFATGYTFNTKMFGQFDFDEILNEIDEGTENIRERLNDRASKLQSEMKTLSSAVTTATTFQFEDGGVQIPVVLNKEAMQNCKAELETLISNLAKVSKDNPVDVTLRLFPLKSDQSEAKEVTDYIKNIRAQIPELPEGELKDSVSNFMDQFEKEYQKALILKIKVALSDDVESVNKKINELKQVVKKAKLEINPSFRITEEEETKLKNKINKVKKDFSFDVAGELTKMSDSLTNLLSSTNPSAWTTAFAEGLGEVRGKLLAMQELINPLYKLMNEKSGTGQPGRPSTETVANRSYVEKFTIAVDSLNNALKAYNKTKSATKADDFVTDVQKQVDESGRVVEIPVSPVVTGFVEKVQDAIGDVPLNITVGGVTASNEGITTVVTQSKTKQTTGSQTSSQKVTEEKKEEITARQQNIELTKAEIGYTNAFNNALNNYIEAIRKMKNAKNDYQSNSSEYEMQMWLNQYPQLGRLTDYPTELEKEEMLTEFLASKGVDRQSHYSPESQWEQLSYLANKKGEKDYKSLIDKFVQYEEDGGTKAITELTDNKTTQKSLEEGYKKFAEKIREKKRQIAQEIIDESEYGDYGTNTTDPKALAEYEKLNAAVEENTQKVEKNTQAKKENGQQQLNTEDYFDSWKQLLEKRGGFNLRKTDDVAKLSNLIDNYNTYKSQGGTRDITDLTDDKATKQKLLDAYEGKSAAVNKYRESLKKASDEEQEIDAKTAAYIEQIQKETEAHRQNEVTTQKETQAVKENTQAKNAKNTVEPSFLQTDIVDEENIKEQAKQQGEEAGKAAVEGAKEGTQEAQDSNSPSKVAEALGGDWGTGYANGILKSEDEVKAAVRQLVSSGTMTAQEIINDIPNIMGDSKYKDLVTPVTDYKSTYKSAITQVKGSITKLNNAEDLSPEQLDNFDASFTKWSTKLKELGVDITKFQNDYSSARAKFGSSIEESLGAVKNEISEEKLTMDEYLQLIKEIGKNYLGDEVVNMIEQTRVKDLKNGSTFTAKSYKVTGQSGSVTLDPNGRVIANRATISDDYTQTQKWNTELLKQRDTYLAEILAKEKAIAIEQNKGNTNTTAELERQRDAAQKLYDLATKDLEAFAEQSVIEEQNAKHVETRRKAENEINTILAQQLDAMDKQAQKEQEIANKQTQKEQQKKDAATVKQQENEYAAYQKKWEQFSKDQENYEKSKIDSSYAEKAQQAYNELVAKVDEYIRARKRIAQGNPLENDIQNVEKLDNEIVELADKMEHQFGSNLADKATAGLSGLESKITEIEQQVAQKTQQKLGNTFKGLKNRLQSSINDIGFEIDHGNHTEEFKQKLESIKLDLKTIESKNIDIITQSDIDQATTLLEQIRQIRKQGKLTENISANKNSIQKNLAQVNSILSGNTKFAFKNTDVYKELVSLQTAFKTFDTSKPQSELAELTTKLLATKAKFEELDNTIKGKNLFQTFIERLHGTTAQLFAMYLSWMDIIRYTRTMINTIKDLDTQLVDLRKTTTMTTTELNEFYNASSDVAKQLGVTTSEIISQASAWSRFNKIDPLYGNI